MSEQISISAGLSREATWAELIPQIEALIAGETDPLANLANIIAAIHQTFGFHWTGFYFVRGEDDNAQLVLGPFQGPIACTRIAKGKGVCGTAWESMRTIVVADVDKFPGHIACSPLSKSEIVVPVTRKNTFLGVLDIDSDQPDSFSEADGRALEKIATIIAGKI